MFAVGANRNHFGLAGRERPLKNYLRRSSIFMEKQTSLRLWLELIWLTITAIVVVAVLWPIQNATASYPFYWRNAGFIVAALTLMRYTFQIKHTFLAKMQGLKIALTIGMLIVFFALIVILNDFMGWVQANEFHSITGHLPEGERIFMEKYIWGEMLFFGIASILAAGAFWVRVIISLWRTHNLGTS